MMADLILKNLDVRVAENRVLPSSSIRIEGGEISGIGSVGQPTPGTRVVDMGGSRMASPGLFDLQVNGGLSHSFSEVAHKAEIETIVNFHRGQGTLWGLPTLVSPDSGAVLAFVNAVEGLEPTTRSWIKGVHVEGPFIDESEKGCHPAAQEFTQARVDALLGPLESLGVPLMVTLSPNVVPLTDIQRLVRRGVIVAVGHADIDGPLLEAAASVGVRMVTHLANCFGGTKPRLDAGVWTALTSDLCVSLIADGHHTSKSFARLVAREKLRGQLVVVSDASPLVGCAVGSASELAGVPIVQSDRGSITQHGKLAGGSSPLLDNGRWLMQQCGVERLDALSACSNWPSRLLGYEIGKSRLDRRRPSS